MSAKKLGDIKRIKRHDPTLKTIHPWECTNSERNKIIDTLIAHPNVITYLDLRFVFPVQETCLRVARYVAVSSTIERLDMGDHYGDMQVYFAMAAALRVNKSLRVLDMYSEGGYLDDFEIDKAFIHALRVNPDRPAFSDWSLYPNFFVTRTFERLKHEAEQLGHPTLQTLLWDKV